MTMGPRRQDSAVALAMESKEHTTHRLTASVLRRALPETDEVAVLLNRSLNGQFPCFKCRLGL